MWESFNNGVDNTIKDREKIEKKLNEFLDKEKEFCHHNGKYTLDKDNKCCKCGLPLKKGIKGIRLPLKPKQR